MWRVCQSGSRSRTAKGVRSLRDAPTKRFYFETKRPIRRVAVIGGGIAGLSCAQRLAAEEKYEVTVFDKGRLRPGGRCSSRRAGDAPNATSDPKRNTLLSEYTYDHAAQVVSCPTRPRHKPFLQYLDYLEEQGVVTPFPENSLYELRSNTKFVPIKDLKYYYGTAEGGGIGGIASFMAKESHFHLKQNVFVSPKHGVEYVADDDQWTVRGSQDGNIPDTDFGLYDALVIAHSGMGAHQLSNLTPCDSIAHHTKVQFEHKLMGDGGSCLSLSSIYSLTFAIPAKDSLLSAKLPSSFLSGFVRTHPVFRFISCQTRKYGAVDDDVEVWTVLSSGAFGKKHEAPLEEGTIPRKIITKVTRLLLLAVENFVTGKRIWNISNSDEDKELGLPKPSKLELLILDKDLQWWPEAVPMNVFEVDCRPVGYLFDGRYRVGVCGDWLVEANIAGAWNSGRLLAEHIMNNCIESHGQYIGASFRRSLSTAKAGIGMLLMESKK